MNVYVFLRQRPIDSEAWPLVYTSRELAEKAEHRISAVVQVNLGDKPSSKYCSNCGEFTGDCVCGL